MLLHMRQRALDAVGDPSAFYCDLCKQYDRQSDMNHFRKGQTTIGRHRDCAKKHQAKYSQRYNEQRRKTPVTTT